MNSNEPDKTKKSEDRKHRYLFITLSVFGGLALAILFFFLLFRLKELGNILGDVFAILRPILIGIAVAYVLKPICNGFERLFLKVFRKAKSPQKWANGFAVACSLLLALLIVYLLLAAIIPALYDSIRGLIDPFLANDGTSPFDKVRLLIENNIDKESFFRTLLTDALDSIEEWLRNLLTSERIIELLKFDTLRDLFENLYSVGGAVVSIVIDIFIGIIAGVYILISRKQLAAQAKLVTHSIFPDRWANAIVSEARFADAMFSGFLYSRVIDSTIVGILCFIGMLFFDTRYALLIAVFVGVTNIIPFFGPFIGAIPSALLLLIEKPINCLWFAIFILVLQQIDGNIIGPRVSVETIGLPELWTLIALLFFGGIFGFVGMLIGVPLFAVIYDVVRRLVNRGLTMRGKSAMLADYSNYYPAKEVKKRLFMRKKRKKEKSAE